MALAQTAHNTISLKKDTVLCAFDQEPFGGHLGWLLESQRAVLGILREWLYYPPQRQAAGLEFFTRLTPPLYDSGTVPLVIGVKPIPEEENWIDEPLPRLPLETRHVRMRFKVAGQGAPGTGFEIETSLYDDES